MNLKQAIALSLFPLIMLAVGCGQTVEQKLIGKWDGKFEIDEAELDKEGNAAAKTFGKAILGSMTMSYHFKTDNEIEMTISTPISSKSVSGTWKVVSQSGNKATIRLEKEGEGGNEQELVFTDSDHFELQAEKAKLVFTRQEAS